MNSLRLSGRHEVAMLTDQIPKLFLIMGNLSVQEFSIWCSCRQVIFGGMHSECWGCY